MGGVAGPARSAPLRAGVLSKAPAGVLTARTVCPDAPTSVAEASAPRIMRVDLCRRAPLGAVGALDRCLHALRALPGVVRRGPAHS